MFWQNRERKLALTLLETARETIDRYDGLTASEAKSRLVADGRQLDSSGQESRYTVKALPDFIFLTDLRSPPLAASKTVIFGQARYGGLALVRGDDGAWIATIRDGMHGPASKNAVRLAKCLAQNGAVYVDWDAALKRRPAR